MKKIIAIVMALVLALSCGVIAFAAHTCPYCSDEFTDDAAYNTHLGICPKKPTEAAAEGNVNVCPYCNRAFASETEYNNHIKTCADQIFVGSGNDMSRNINVNAIIDRLIEVFKTDAAWWAAVEGIIIRLIDLVENIGSGLVSSADVAGAIADLEGQVDLLGIGGDILANIKNLINTIKQKIKDFYCHETETVVEETEAEAPADTGSTSIGIACFAAVSVAAAAAYVCTKKKED